MQRYDMHTRTHSSILQDSKIRPKQQQQQEQEKKSVDDKMRKSFGTIFVNHEMYGALWRRWR